MGKRKIKVKGILSLYTIWPVILGAFLLLMLAVIFAVDSGAGIVAAVFVGIYCIFVAIVFVLQRPKILSGLINFATEYNRLQRNLSKEMKVPYAVLDVEGHVLWMNDEFELVSGAERASRQAVTHLFDGIDIGVLPAAEQDTSLHIVHRERNYLVEFRRISATDSKDDIYWKYEEGQGDGDTTGDLISMYMFDETETTKLRKELSDHRVVVGLIYIDNYEEVLESIDEVRRSLLTALVDRKISKTMQSVDAVVKKLEKDKYLCIFPNKYLPQLRQNRFPVLDEVRTVNVGNDLPVTISIGISAETESFVKAYDQARAAIDLALGRGGDQVVLREDENNFFYGGKSMSVEKNTRVKARVKAHALRELIEGKDEVLVMGHSIGDVDSFGAAIGVYRIAKSLETKAHIVINAVTTPLRPLMNRFLNNAEYEEDLFMNSEEAKEAIGRDTLLVLVDVNRASYSECPELIDLAESVVIIDHHRMTEEIPDKAVLSYIEPYASSACEMVAEILQYTGDGVKIKQTEADAMYAGMMIDTSNFLTKTGVRTFEAAAFLRRNGADVTRIRKMFRTEMEEYKIRAAAVANAEVFCDFFAFATLDKPDVESPTIVAAQVANDLMDIANIKASFVFTEYNEKVYISARSIDEYNVQVLMERLGGGGHMSAAGAQLSDCSTQEAVDKVKDILKDIQKEGEA